MTREVVHAPFSLTAHCLCGRLNSNGNIIILTFVCIMIENTVFI